MTPTIQFLTALGQAFAAITLYSEEHPMRQAAIARLRATIETVLVDGASLRLAFIDSDVIAGGRPITDLRGWEWAARLSAAGVQRLELSAIPLPTATDVDAMLTELRSRMASPGEPPRLWSCGSIRVGPLASTTASVGEISARETPFEPHSHIAAPGPRPDLAATQYAFSEVADGRKLPAVEVEAAVRSLANTLRRTPPGELPLLDTGAFAEYAATHACNVAMLAMRLSEALGLSDGDIHCIGAAALVHDIGNLRLPSELLLKSGALCDHERSVIESHPLEGARLLSTCGSGLGLAGTVAYEHHLSFAGRGGYPALRFPRSTHYASRIVHVCAIYDALCSRRPYRDAWTSGLALDLIRTLAGSALDPAIAAAFVRMVSGAVECRPPMAVIAA